MREIFCLTIFKLITSLLYDNILSNSQLSSILILRDLTSLNYPSHTQLNSLVVEGGRCFVLHGGITVRIDLRARLKILRCRRPSTASSAFPYGREKSKNTKDTT